MGSLVLKIDAEDKDAIKAYAEMTKAERELELQAKKLNVTLKEQGALEKKNAKERKEEARQKRVAMSFANNAAKAQLQADRARRKQVIDTNRQITKEAHKTGGAFDVMGKKMVLGLGGGLAAAALVVRAMEAVRAEQDRLNTINVESARRANQEGRGLREFAGLQAEGPEGQAFLRETILGGTERGLMPNQTGKIAQPIQSLADKDGDGNLDEKERAQFDTDFGAAAKMIEAGVNDDDALRIITSGRARGQSGQESADLLIRGAETSAQGPAVFARSISATGEFSDQKEALAILSALTKEQTDEGKLPAAMERLSLVLGAAGEAGETAVFSDKYGLDGQTETEKVETLRQHAIKTGDQSLSEEERVRAFTAQLSNETGISKEQAMDLGRVVRQAQAAGETRQILESGSEGRLDAALEKLMADPLTRGGILEDRQKALTAANDMVGPQSEAGQAEQAKRQQGGLKRMQAGQLDFIDPSTGEEIPYSDRSYLQKRQTNNEEAAGRFGRTYFGDGEGKMDFGIKEFMKEKPADAQGTMDAQKEFANALRENAKAMQENTKAIEQHSKAGAGRAPVGGSAANAEEKY